MPLRDLLLFAVILGGIPFYFFQPFVGILAFHFVSLMNPHRYTWGAAYDFTFAKVIAIVTIAGFILGQGTRYTLPKERETWLILLLWLLFTFTTFFAFFPDDASRTYSKITKIFIMVFLTMIFCCDQQRLIYLALVVVFSIGLIGVKGGVFGILTGGVHTIWGPPGSFIADNNDLGLAFNMVLPLIFCLARMEENKTLRRALLVLFFLTALSTVLTFSRGAVVTLAPVLFLLAVRSQRKAGALFLILLFIAFSSFYLTERWSSRMDTISQASEDASFMGRVNAWKYSWNLALDRPLTGGGFEGRSEELFNIYGPPGALARDVHNIYFEVLGEHGFPALFVFLILFGGLFLNLNTLRKRYRKHPHYGWISEYANALQISLFAYLLNGMTLVRAYFDLTYLLVAMGIMLKTMSKQIEASQAKTHQEKSVTAPDIAPERQPEYT